MTPALDLERSILGACLVDSAQLAHLSADTIALFSASHRKIAAAMIAATTNGAPPEVALVRAELGDDWDRIGGHAYLTDLIVGASKSTAVPWLIARLRRERDRTSALTHLQAAQEAIRDSDDPSVVADLIDAAQASLESKDTAPLNPINLRSVLEAPIIDPPWVVPRWLAAGEKVVFGAKSGYGKSYVTLDLALALASAGNFLGMPAKQQRVTVIDEENSVIQNSGRLQYLMRGRNIAPDTAETMPLRVFSDQAVRFCGDPVARLRRDLDAHPPDWIVVDSLVRFLGGADENSSTAMSALFSDQLDALRVEYGCGIFVLHHVKKPPTGIIGAPDPQDSVRGSGDITAWPDCVWIGQRDGEVRVLSVVKTRWLCPTPSLSIGLDPDPDVPGSYRLVVAAEEAGADGFVGGKLTMAGDVGMLRRDLIDEYEEATGLSASSAERAVSRALSRMRRSGTVKERREGQQKRFILAEYT